jgi:EmrB/QacA subfamily drug resistance transporter
MDNKASETSTPLSQQTGRRLYGAALGFVMTALMLTVLLEALDQTVVGTALPKIIGTLQGFDRYTWAVTAYTLASTTLIPIVSKLSDQFGRKWFLLIGTAIFLLGSMLTGASATMTQFIAFRALQGVGAGMGIALVAASIGDIFPPAERAKWQGLFSAVYGVSNLIGPTLGGYLADHGPLLGSLVLDSTRWRWVFYINLPIGIAALIVLFSYLPGDISERTSRFEGWASIRRIDFLGAALISGGTVCLLLGLTWGSNQIYDWNSPQVIGILVGAGVLYTLFFTVERFVAEPILPLDLFRNQTFAVAGLLSMLPLMVLVGLIIYLPLFLQGVLGISATYSGAVITPMSVASVIGASVAGILMQRLKRFQAISIVGAIVMSIGVFFMTRMTATTGLLEATIFMVAAGLGLGTFFSVAALAAQNSVPRSRLGVGTGVTRLMGQFGSVLGVALVGTVVNNSLSSELAPRLAKIPGVGFIPPAVLKLATNPQVLVSSDQRNALLHGVAQNTPPQFQASAIQTLNHVFDAVKQSLAVSVVQGFVVVLFICGAVFLCTLFFKDVPLQAAQAAPAGEASDAPDQPPEAAPVRL